MPEKHKGMKDKIKALKEKYIGAKTDKERNAIREERRIFVLNLSPDDDLARAITMDELLLGV
jgi:hypothetical protein